MELFQEAGEVYVMDNTIQKPIDISKCRHQFTDGRLICSLCHASMKLLYIFHRLFGGEVEWDGKPE